MKLPEPQCECIAMPHLLKCTEPSSDTGAVNWFSVGRAELKNCRCIAGVLVQRYILWFSCAGSHSLVGVCVLSRCLLNVTFCGREWKRGRWLFTEFARMTFFLSFSLSLLLLFFLASLHTDRNSYFQRIHAVKT